MAGQGSRGRFAIERTGFFSRKRRLVASEKLTPTDFDDIAATLGVVPVRARKITLVSARQATEHREVVTKWKGEVTKNVAEPGDWLVTNLDATAKPLRDAAGKANTYVIRAARFGELYDRAPGEGEFGPFFKGKAEVRAIPFNGGFDIAAPWGERQTATDGYILLNGADVYGNERTAFETTYEVLS